MSNYAFRGQVCPFHSRCISSIVLALSSLFTIFAILPMVLSSSTQWRGATGRKRGSSTKTTYAERVAKRARNQTEVDALIEQPSETDRQQQSFEQPSQKRPQPSYSSCFECRAATGRKRGSSTTNCTTDKTGTLHYLIAPLPRPKTNVYLIAPLPSPTTNVYLSACYEVDTPSSCASSSGGRA